MHGFGIALCIQQVSEDLVKLNQALSIPKRLHW
jgi:hypothetical protein